MVLVNIGVLGLPVNTVGAGDQFPIGSTHNECPITEGRSIEVSIGGIVCRPTGAGGTHQYWCATAGSHIGSVAGRKAQHIFTNAAIGRPIYAVRANGHGTKKAPGYKLSGGGVVYNGT